MKVILKVWEKGLLLKKKKDKKFSYKNNLNTEINK